MKLAEHAGVRRNEKFVPSLPTPMRCGPLVAGSSRAEHGLFGVAC